MTPTPATPMAPVPPSPPSPLPPGIYPVAGGYLVVNANGQVTMVPAQAPTPAPPQPVSIPDPPSRPFYKSPVFWSHFAAVAGTIAISMFVKNPQSQQRIGSIADPILQQLGQTQ